MPRSPQKIGVAVAAVTGLVGAAVGGYALRRKSKKQICLSSTTEFPAPTDRSSHEEVAQWLSRIGVSEPTMAVFRGELITGSSLLNLTDQDIVLLSATANDAKLILEALRKASKPGALDEFLKETQAMFVSIATQPATDPEERAKQLHSVLYAFKSFQMLPTDLQASALLPLSRQVTAAQALARAATAFGLSSEKSSAATSTDLRPGMSPEKLQATVQSLHDMLDRFLETAQIGLNQLPPAESADLKRRLLDQVERVEEIARAMPKAVAQPLLEKCVRLRAELNRSPGVSAGPPAGGNDEAVSMPELLLRLRDLFTSVKNGGAMTMPPAQRVAHLTEVVEELHGITDAAKNQPESEHRTMALSVAKTVGDLVQQMLTLAKQEEDSGDRAEAAVEVPQEDPESLHIIVGDLGKVFRFLNSNEYESLSEERRPAVVAMVARDVDRLRVRVEASEDPGKVQVLRDLVFPLQALITSMNSVEVVEGSEPFQNIRSCLLSILQVVSAPEFSSNLNPDSRNRVADEVKEQMVRIGDSLGDLGPEERASAEGLVLRINNAINQAFKPAGESNIHEEPSTEVSQRVLGNIQTVMDSIQRPDFSMSSRSEQTKTIHSALLTLLASREEAVGLGEAGRPLIVFIDDIVPSIQALSDNAQLEASEEDDGVDEVDARKKVFDALTSLAGDLEEKNASTATVSAAQLERFKKIRQATEAMENKTTAEQATLQRFDSALTAAGGQVESDPEDSVRSFTETVQKISDRVGQCDTTTELRPLLQMMERVVAAADRCEIPWRDDRDAVAQVTQLLERIQDFKNDHPEDEEEPSEKEKLETALEAMKESPPQTMEELIPYYNVLRSACLGGVENTDLVEALQLAVREAVERIQQHPKEKIDSELISNLMEMSHALRETALPEHVLNSFSEALDEASRKDLTPEVHRAIEAIREQIHLQRRAVQQVDTEEGAADVSETDDPAKDSESEEPASPMEKKDDAPESQPRAAEASPDDQAQVERDLALFPRIEAHVALPEDQFHSSITPFDLSFIKLVLKRLISSPSITDDSLKQRIARTKERLEKLLGEESTPAEESEPSTSLRVVAHERENSDGNKSVNFVIHTKEEADEPQHKENAELMSTLNSEAQTAEQPSLMDRSKWDGQSLAILLNDPKNTQDQRKSVGHELSVLDDALAQNGFDVVHASPALGSRQAFETMLQDAMKSKPSRLFVYNSCGENSEAPRNLVFEDGSQMNLGDVMSLTEPAERTVVASCHPNRLDLNYRHEDHTGPCVGIQLSPKAVEDLQAKRCAIFDGIFTPIVADFLGTDHASVTMCPEDLLRRVVSVASSSPCCAGMHGGKAGKMGYFR